MTQSAVYFGHVRHVRFRPMRHAFRYAVFSLYLDLDDIPALARRSRIFAHNGFGLLGFHDRDHGPGADTPLRPWVERHLHAAAIADADARIMLLCYPRILGYVFNPLSVYFCHGRDGALRALLYEVHNTFGDRHVYLLRVRDAATGVLHHRAKKALHVSPFLGMEAAYRFRTAPPDEALRLSILESDGQGALLYAALDGERRPLDDRTLARALLRYPLMTLKVIAAIHFHALRLWLKGARFHRRPGPPACEVSYGTDAAPDPAATPVRNSDDGSRSGRAA